MLDLRYVSENIDAVRAELAKRGFDDSKTFDKISELAAARLKNIAAVETLRQKRNEASSAMGKIADKKSDEFQGKRAELRSLGDEIKNLEVTNKQTQAELEELMLHLPNLPAESAPVGPTEEHNVVLRDHGEKPSFSFTPKEHFDIGTDLDVIDFERAVKISGARFVVLKGLGSRLERALMQFMLDVHVDEHGYTEVWTPTLVKDTAMRGTTQLPKFAKDAFKIHMDEEWEKEADAAGHELYLCPTGEVPITNLHANEILDAEQLPIAYCGYTACFRSEAGTYGKDTRGMIRVHQFDKVELVRFVKPEDAEEQHALLTSHAESILQRLGLHYRVQELCTGDMGFGAKKCFDMEVWLPGQNAYREISSCSWFGDFQARRMKSRYRPAPKAKPQMLHTINGSGLAIGRTLVAILENYQNADGTVTIPEVLRPYMGGKSLIPKPNA